MSIDKYKKIFKKQRNYSIGVEEEFMICNPNTGELINKASETRDAIVIKIYLILLKFRRVGK